MGGTGRSGTTIAAQLLGAHPQVMLIPVELRFHVDGGGLTDLAAGRIDLDGFEQKLWSTWFHRPPNRSGPRGVHVVAEEAHAVAELRSLRDALGEGEDRWHACGTFMDRLLRPACERAGARTWVEMTPPNARQADALCRMFPQARLVHMVRDGRDVAASVARRTWGPNDISSALAWWKKGVVTIHRALERADPDRVRTIRLEELVVGRRDEEYASLLTFTGLDDDESMRQFFDSALRAEDMHEGRWRHGLDPQTVQKVQEEYVAYLRELDRLGIAISGP
ncbi:hypothetical protein BJF80_00190 [Serinicoccus sp. CUA-874]|uniref:sulfotransferase family protein n=1 Tax=Serinicoccus sp. CUA-874 TaxID=1517939 RepID=UPI00095C5320|nr:sulfotransferase [Serinicoccus sp. CUA-874]OLT17796.1 hypothetical protein BJF80_00190 [Serinicoccus sp. CUA-874]